MSKARDLADFQGSASALTTGTLPVDRVPYVGRRNLIINGGFDVWQRGTSGFSVNQGYSADRWRLGVNNSTVSVSQSSFTLGQTDVPNEPKHYLTYNVTTSSSSTAIAELTHPIEDVRVCAGQTVTVSFYAKADAAKNIAIEFYQMFGSGGSPSGVVYPIGNQLVPLTTSWTKHSITAFIPSISGKTIGTDNNSYLAFRFWFEAGSNFNINSTSLGNQSGTFDIAQVQLELGKVATPFEHRSYGEELALCSRYYQQTYIYAGRTTSGGERSGTTGFNVRMRADPSASIDANIGETSDPSLRAQPFAIEWWKAVSGTEYVRCRVNLDAEL